MPKIKKNEKGFTLVELSIVLVVGGIITAMTFNLAMVALNNMSAQKNNSKFKFVQEEINRFLETNGRLPCPAPLNKDVDTAEFGREALTDCSQNTSVSGTFTTTGRAGKIIRIGAIPVRTLNLPDEYIYDAYDSRFLYAVTGEMTNISSYSHDIGAISVQDANGNSTITPDGSAPYIILSSGENQSGGYTGLSGVEISSCASISSNSEKENCNNDDIFISSYLTLADGSNYFDDTIVTYQGDLNKGSVPAGAVMFFDLDISESCPDGWINRTITNPPIENLKSCKKE